MKSMHHTKAAHHMKKAAEHHEHAKKHMEMAKKEKPMEKLKMGKSDTEGQRNLKKEMKKGMK